MGAAQRIMEDAIASPSGHVPVFSASSQPSADIRIANQRKRNIRDSISYLQAADSVLEEVASLLLRAMELADQAKADLTHHSSRIGLDVEFKKIVSTLSDILRKTQFNGAPVFTSTGVLLAEAGSGSVGLADGSNRIPAAIAINLSATTLTLTSPTGAEAAAGAISIALEANRSLRTSMGVSKRELIHLANMLALQVENLTAVHTQTRDSLIAEEVVNLTKFQILYQCGTSDWGQARSTSRQILTLLTASIQSA